MTHKKNAKGKGKEIKRKMQREKKKNTVITDRYVNYKFIFEFKLELVKSVRHKLYFHKEGEMSLYPLSAMMNTQFVSYGIM